MPGLSVDVSLSDVALAIQYSGNSESERQEVMDFLIDVDRGMADVDWSTRLVSHLAESLRQELDTDDWGSAKILVETDLAVPGLPDGTVTVPVAIPVERIARALAVQTPHLAVAILGEAVFLREAADEKVKAQRAAEVCGNCAHTRGHHYEADSDFYEACQDTHCMCQEFTEFCGLVACGHSMKNHNTPFPCANDTHRANCHPCAVAAKES